MMFDYQAQAGMLILPELPDIDECSQERELHEAWRRELDLIDDKQPVCTCCVPPVRRMPRENDK